MSKKREKNKRKEVKAKEVTPKEEKNITLSSSELESIIVNALLKAEEIKKENEQAKIDAEKKEREKFFGWNDHVDANKCIRWILIMGNRIKVLFKILFMRKEKISGTKATSALIKMILSFVFKVFQVALLFLGVCCVAFIPLQYYMPNITSLKWYYNFIVVILAYILFVLSRVFRMARIEIEKLDDLNVLFGLFAVITSIISIAIAIVAIVT